MDLQNLRERLAGALKSKRLSQIECSRQHGLSYSTLNKFLKGHLRNPRLSTIEQYEHVIRSSASAKRPMA